LNSRTAYVGKIIWNLLCLHKETALQNALCHSSQLIIAEFNIYKRYAYAPSFSSATLVIYKSLTYLLTQSNITTVRS